MTVPDDLHVFTEDWEQAPVVPAPAAHRPGCTVVFLSDPHLQQEVRGRLAADEPGSAVVTVGRGAAGFRRLAADRYEIGGDADTELREAYGTLLRAVTDEHGPVGTVVHLWAADDRALLWEPDAVVTLLQTLVRQETAPERIVLGGAFEDPAERCAAEAWLGFERSAGIVLPGTRITALLLDDAAYRGGLPELLAAELGAADPVGALYEGGRRHVQRVRTAGPEPVGPELLRRGGTYLITGGTGGLGRIFGTWLAREYAARLVLVGRRPQDAAVERLLADLTAAGATALYCQADVCDEAALAAAVDTAVTRFGGIDGVLHAAGLEQSGNIGTRELSVFRSILGPKISGTVNLEKALRGRAPGFVVYFSSSAAVLGDFGSCDYACGNRFQMSYARHLAATDPAGPRRLAVNWPLWNSDGMNFADDTAKEFYLRSSGQRFLEPDEGTALLRALLGRGGPQYLALAGQADRVRAMLKAEGPLPASVVRAASVVLPSSAAPVAPERTVASEPGREAASEPGRTAAPGRTVAAALEQELKTVVSQILRIPVERLATDENFQDFGFDSISLVEFAGVLSELLRIDITPDLFFSHTTLRGLHTHLLDRYDTHLGERHGSATAAAPEPAPEPAREPAAGEAPRPARPVRRTRRATGSRFAPAPVPVGTEADAPAPARAEEPIAVIGMSGRFPNARDVDELWRLLVEGRSAVRPAPQDRDPSWADGKERRLGWVPGIAEFDPRFFEIAPSEAETMDPRQRLLLEEMWKALEDAGCGREQLAGQRAGVFVGVEEGDYRLLAAEQEGITSNHNAVLAARLSYFLDLTGPSLAVNTACSSGLVALHEACLSLRNGDCDTAIVAGVNLMATPREYDALDGAGMLSSDGVCRAFDRRADGMVPGEAVAVVVLKRQDAAERDRHPVLARILATGINNDGRTNGITAPSGAAQTRLVREVQRRAGISADSVDHVVTHGTGTRLGDPVEINALTEAFRPDTDRTGFCALTSTKPAVGHSLAASGLVSLIALVLSLRHETIPPSVNCEQISDFVRWQDTPFHVNRTARPWAERPGTPRRGAVSAFGFSGTNAHVVLESRGTARGDLDRLGAQPAAPWHLLLCSAKTDTALAGQLRALADRLAASPDTGPGLMASVSHTLMAGRHHFGRRCALVVRDREEAVRALRRAAETVEHGAERPGTQGDVSFGTVARDAVADPEDVRAVRELAATGPGSEHASGAYRQVMGGLARAYCQGHEPAAFAQLWGGNPPERTSLPGYVFDHADHWVAGTPVAATGAAGSGAAGSGERLHPLVHRNTSDLNGQRYTAEFTGEEPWFGRDRALTAGARLELARAAVILALGEGELPLTLDEVAHHEPPAAAGPRTLRIDLRAAGDGSVDWALYDTDGDESCLDGDESCLDADETCLVADGRASRASSEEHRTDALDLTALRTRCTRELPAPWGAVRLLADLATGGEQHLLLEPADTASAGLVLVPQLLDVCLEAVRAQLPAARTVTGTDRAAFAAQARPVRWAHVVVRPESASADIALAADDGTVVVRLDGLTLSGQPVESSVAVAAAVAPAQDAVAVAAGEGRRPEMRGWTVPECLAWELADAAGRTLKIQADQLDPDENLANFGFDSLNITRFATELSQRLGFTLTPDVFFSHPTLGRLAGHLLTDHTDRMRNRYREATAAPATPTPTPVTPAPARETGPRLAAPRSRTTGRGDDTHAPAAPAPVAVVGMSGRFPDARSVDGLWSILAEGRSVVREVPEERLPWWRTGGSEEEDRGRRFGAVPGIDEFDPLFFETSPREAELMDPRQRLLLQEMWHALEDAGYGERALTEDKVGIFVGVEEGDYRYLVDGDASVTSNSTSVLAARLAYFLDLSGPTMAINTSCSSGLVALHEACLSLRYGDCDTAIVAGASLMSSAHDYLAMEKATMLAPDRTCYAFDRRASGMVPGEAVAVLVLRRLPDAERDGHRIHATVLGSGINYDGRTNGLTAPSGEAQSRLLRSVYERHGIAPDTLDYVVAHGTGTRLGDPIEVNALADAFRSLTDRTRFCALTSIKPNIGHSMAASGLVNLIALLAAMRHETIPPSINCDELSDYIDWDASPFFVNREARHWPVTAGRPRRGAVSSFGVSGTNAHVVLQAYDDQRRPGGPRPEPAEAPSHLLLLSAKDEDALTRRLHELADHLESTGEDAGSLASVSRTLMTGRIHFAHRCALVVQDRADAVRLLREAVAGTRQPRLYRSTVARRFAPNHTVHKAVEEVVRSGRAKCHDPAAHQDHLAALAEFYCQGYAPAFEGLWDTPPNLVGLPVYPFAAERHWAPAAPAYPAAAQAPRPPHSLVHEHTSDGTVHRFSTRVTGGRGSLEELLVPAGTDRHAAAR